MAFRSWLDRESREIFYSKPGSGIVDVMSPVVDNDGRISLVVSGKHDLYSEIQSHKDSVDIHVLLQRFKNGDIDALNRRSGAFIDVTDMPQNYAELLNTMIETRQYFDSLSPEIKGKFHDDFGEFVSSFGSEAFIKAFSTLKDDVVKDAPEAVKEVIESE